MFDNAAITPHMVGTGAEPLALADTMSRAWIAFARSGNPNVEGPAGLAGLRSQAAGDDGLRSRVARRRRSARPRAPIVWTGAVCSARYVVAIAVVAVVDRRWRSRRRAHKAPPDRAQVLAAMKRATTFMVEKVAYKGGYVWSYLPDLSRRWGEMEATPTMIWIQPPGTPSMGHLFLDAYHATGDEYYYRAAEQVASALDVRRSIRPAAGTTSPISPARRRCGSGTTPSARTRWRLEEFQHYYGNATFDDAGTAESAKFFLRLYRREEGSEIQGAARQGDQVRPRQPVSDRRVAAAVSEGAAAGLHGLPDYTSYATFNDDVAAENMDFLLMCYQAFGDRAAARSDRPRHERLHRRRSWDRRSRDGDCSTRSICSRPARAPTSRRRS